MRVKLLTPFLADHDKKDLPTVTLVGVTSVAVKQTIAAMRQSSTALRFAQSILFTHDRPPLGLNDHIKWHKIPRLNSRDEYSQFMVHGLVDHIQTEHVLCVQWDGFVIRPEAWSDAFLEFDFIGARWPQFEGSTVGNGGFSLRSRKLLQAAKQIHLLANEAEDIAICRRCRPVLEQQDIRFATPQVADLFSFERTTPSGKEFGFHGIFNFRSVLGPRPLRDLVTGLDPGLIGDGELRELIKQSIGSLDFPLTIQLLRRKVLQY